MDANSERTLPPRWVIATFLFSTVLLIGAGIVWLATASHLFSTLLHAAIIMVFVWVILKIGMATYAQFNNLLGHKLALAFAVLVAAIVGIVLFAALDTMGHDIVHHRFEQEAD